MSIPPSRFTDGAPGAARPVLDLVVGLEIADGDEALRDELLALFAEELPRLVGEVRAALAAAAGGPTESGDDLVRAAAHALKGSASHVGAVAVYQAARDLEEAARLGRSDAFPTLGTALEDAVTDLRRHPAFPQFPWPQAP